MLEVDNRTSWSAGVYPGWGGEGGRKWTVVIKAGFSFDQAGQLTPVERPPIEEADRYHGELGKSSLAAACEVVPFKAGGEILLTGTAHPPRPDATVMEVEIALSRTDGSGWRKALRVFGPRRWERNFFGAVPGSPAPISPLPLIYEHAFGGGDPGTEDLRNPVGKGYNDRRRGELPQIEIGPSFITSPSSRPEPAGFGPLPFNWEPRAKLFQKLGGEIEGRELPPDLYNAAPLDQRFQRPFEGGELLGLRGIFPGGGPEGIQFPLPRLRPHLTLVTSKVERTRVVGEDRRVLKTVWDTVVVDGDRQEFYLLGRSGVELGPDQAGSAKVILHDHDLNEGMSVTGPRNCNVKKGGNPWPMSS